VTVRFGPHQAWRVGAGLGRRGRVSREADGAIRLRLEHVNPEGLISWVLGMGRDVQVVSPRGLKAEVAGAARRVAERHSGRGRAR
jgi:hypothetical protein